VGANPLDPDDGLLKIYSHHQPVVIALDIEDNPVGTDDARGGIKPLHVRRADPVRLAYFGEPRVERRFQRGQILMPSPLGDKLAQGAPRYNPHNKPPYHAPNMGAIFFCVAILAGFDAAIVKDMFEEDGYFADADQFWAAQSAEVERRKAAYLEDGWSSVEIIPPGSHFNDWQYEKTPKRKGGRIYIQVKAKGEVIFHEGYLTDKEARRRDDETSGIIKQPAPARPEITSAMTSYIDLHRHAAVRSALATQPSLALRVMVAHAICGSPLWRVEVQDQRSRNAAVTESIETSVAEARFDERRRAVLAVLGFDPETATVTKGHEPMEGVTGLFARLLEIPDRTVMEVLAIVMAETLASGSCLIESIGLHIGVDMADYWVADNAFYSLIRDRDVLTAILREVGGDAVAQAHVAEKGKTIKSVINDFLTGENGRAKREHWVPRWMAFPPTAYTARGGVAMLAAANRVRWQAEAEEPTDPAPQAPAMLPEPGNDADETAEVLSEAEPERLAA
jgi:ParB family transcriptional regulator, chromosome partitioning protein